MNGSNNEVKEVRYCPKCGGELWKRGRLYKKVGFIQKWECKKCRKVTTRPLTEPLVIGQNISQPMLVKASSPSSFKGKRVRRVSDVIWKLHEKGIKNARISELLDISRQRVSQVLKANKRGE